MGLRHLAWHKAVRRLAALNTALYAAIIVAFCDKSQS